MLLRTRVHLIVPLLFAASVALAQPTPGLPAFGSFSGGPFDTIDNANLNVHFAIPTVNKAGRGLPFTYTLTYDNSIWAPVTSGSSKAWTPVSDGWGAGTEIETGYVTYTTTQTQCYSGNGQPSNYDQFTNFNYIDGSGTPHALPVMVADWGLRNLNCQGTPPPTTATGTTEDQSGYTVTVQALYGSAYASLIVNLAGTVITPNTGGTSGNISDSNGNELSFSTTSGTTTFTDTLGTAALAIPSTGLLTYYNPQGTNSSYTPTYQSYAAWTSFGCSGVSEYNGLITLLKSLALPDGTSYSFTYEASSGHSGYTTGRIASVTLPTGGTISYAYSGGSNGINCSDGSTPTLTRTTPDGAWGYTRSGSTTTITDPQNNQTALIFQGLYEVQRKVYQGSTSGTLLKTVDTCYNGSASPCTTTAVYLPITQLSAITSLPGSSTLKSQIVAMYNSSSGLLGEVDQYDYGTGAVGSLVRKTVTAYNTSLGNNIQNRPSSVTIETPSGGTVAQTTYTYDEAGTLYATSNTPQHVAVSGSRGNATTVTQTTGSTSLTRHFTYFDTGNVYTATDVNGAVTTYTYGACGNSFVTGTALPLSLSTSATWDTPTCYGAVQRTATDANGNTATTYYGDANFWRPTSVMDLAGATTNIYYATNPTAVESILNFNSNNSTSATRTTLDSLGRTHVSQRRQAYGTPGTGNYDSVETDYDPAGRPSRVTMPYSTTFGGTNSSAPATTTTYDALNRPLVVTDGGSGTTTYSYTQNDVLVTVGPQVTSPQTENTKKRQLEYDGLGRLTSVCEVSGASGSGTCGQNASQTGFWTKYTYNLLDNLVGVTQNAQSSTTQTRTFAYL